MRELAGNHAVVTGGASGIGRAIVARLARAGMRVVVADVEASALAATVEELRAGGADATSVAVDVTRFASVRELERRAVAAYGPVHLLCNNAGVGAQEDVPLWELPLSDWRWTLDVSPKPDGSLTSSGRRIHQPSDRVEDALELELLAIVVDRIPVPQQSDRESTKFGRGARVR